MILISVQAYIKLTFLSVSEVYQGCQESYAPDDSQTPVWNGL